MINTSVLKKQKKNFKLIHSHLSNGQTKGKSEVLGLKEATEDTVFQTSFHQTLLEGKSVTPEFQLPGKDKIWRDKLISLEARIQLMSLSRMLDQESTLKEKDYREFWNTHVEEKSKKLWLPTKIDCVDSVLNLSTSSSQSAPMGKSWFSITKIRPLNKISLPIYYPSLQSSLQGCTDLEVINSKSKSKKRLRSIKLKDEVNKRKQEPVRTLKLRLFPTEEEKVIIHEMIAQQRWYYNLAVSCFYKHFKPDYILSQDKFYYPYLRDNVFSKYEYKEEMREDGKVNKIFTYREDQNKSHVPYWWSKIHHCRIPRGAYHKFTSALNSALSNLKAGNIKEFELKFKSRKNLEQTVYFEDECYPVLFKYIKSVYWFRNKERKRTTISLSNLPRKGCEIVYDLVTDRYFIHAPVPVGWFPIEDRRNDKQAMLKNQTETKRIIALDPGIRKFMVGYDPNQSITLFGKDASFELTKLMLEVDKVTDSATRKLMWRRIKNLVNELHWKCIHYLISNYDIIVFTDFKVSQMLKGKLNKKTKRLMGMFSFFSFKQKLIWKCKTHDKQLLIINESYTSKTCTCCGFVNKKNSNETLSCSKCGFKLDRDIIGARNIYLKSVSIDWQVNPDSEYIEVY